MSDYVDRIKALVWGEGNYVALERIENGELVYNVHGPDRGTLLEFRVPHADQLGATFHLSDTTKVFMRWIRKAVEKKIEEEQVIEQARIDWAKENPE